MRFLFMLGTFSYALAFWLPFIAAFTDAKMDWL